MAQPKELYIQPSQMQLSAAAADKTLLQRELKKK
jgi:hypothetical protein